MKEDIELSARANPVQKMKVKRGGEDGDKKKRKTENTRKKSLIS